MNTSTLKSFAPAVRRDLMEAVSRKLDVVLAARTPDYRTNFAPQVAVLAEQARADRAGLVERVAYTWFNRLAALRYLDARGWHPFRARVLTPADAGSTQPELLKLQREGALPEELARHTDPARLDDLLDGRLPSPNPQAEVYRHLVLAASRYYHALLPDLFERLDYATELLLPDDLLTEQSPVAGFRTAITDEDCADVEVLGWLYQFYISERKDAVMARKAAVPSADIPAVTQLFTPHWIVRYLVENSLGRLWLLNRPGSRLRERMPYYVETEPETDFLRIGRPEEIRVLDPAAGSGHMLTYAFDLLYAIYEEEGYAASEIPGLILRHNLYGVDIDPRATQLAQLALVLKARERSRRFFQPVHRVQPNVIALEDVRFEPGELQEYVRALDLGPLFDAPVLELLCQFEQATTFGSLIQPVLGAGALADLRRSIEAADVSGQLLLAVTHEKVLTVLAQAEYLTRRYHVVVANPPYLGGKTLTASLKQFVAAFFEAGKADLYAAFIQRNTTLVVPSGLIGMITIPNWLFLSSFERLRALLLDATHMIAMLHNGRGVWGGDFGSVTFVLKVGANSAYRGVYRRLFRKQGEIQNVEELRENFFNLGEYPAYLAASSDFGRLPGQAFVYWLSAEEVAPFRQYPRMGEIVDARQGLATSDNERFLRFWWEVALQHSCWSASSRSEARASGRKWFPINRGGPFRKWYGNQLSVINWENDGAEVLDYAASLYGSASRTIKSASEYFKPAVSWSDITSSTNAFRYYPAGFIFNVTGHSAFPESRSLTAQLLAFCNSRYAQQLVSALNPTIHFDVGYFKVLPAAVPPAALVEDAVWSAITMAKADWDAYEQSWAFAAPPLMRLTTTAPDLLSRAWGAWASECNSRKAAMGAVESRLNAVIAVQLNLPAVYAAPVREEQITLSDADRYVDAAALLSYAVGCAMGRYSLEQSGLILADAGATLADYLAKTGKPLNALTFAPDTDGIIPVLDGEWFEDDIVARMREFLRATFGDATLRENLRWLEESLGKDLRKYFLTHFYKDHLQTYKKRPIYWLVQSPKKGFSVLIYLHRYTRDTLNVVLNRYLREYQGKLRSRLAQIAQQLAGDTLPARDRTTARKEQDRLTKVLHECEEWERQSLLPLAQQRIALDLDDGVKVNYLKLADVLAPIPGLAVAEA